MKVLVTGSTGQLGYDVCRLLEEKGIPFAGTSSRELDITDREAVERCMEAYRPDTVIHCAAYTAVDLSEKEQEHCFRVNCDGVGHVACACERIGAKLLYVSTDYVFSGSGSTPYEISEMPDPVNVYGCSKAAGEKIVRETASRHFIVRTSWMFGINGKNFINSILEKSERDPDADIRVVSDQIGSPTYTVDLAKFLVELIGTDRYGIYHATNEGFCSWAELAQEALRLAGRKNRVIPIPAREYSAPADRPENSRLSKRSLTEHGFDLLPDWKAAVKEYIKEREQKKLCTIKK